MRTTTQFLLGIFLKKINGKVEQVLFLVSKKCTSCVTCASVQGQGRKTKPPLKSIAVGGPFEVIGMDFKQMDTIRHGNCYALVLQDYLTKWPGVYAVADRSAKTVAICLVDFIWKHGVPIKIIHNRATELASSCLTLCRRPQ